MTLHATFARAAGGRQRLADGFNARTMRDTGARADREIQDAVDTTEAAYAAIDKAAARLRFTDEAAIEQLKAEWLGRFRSAWAAFQGAGARTANWMVTGPSRFPVERNRKRMETEHRRLTEMLEISRGAPAWAEKRIKRLIREQLGPLGMADKELTDARAKLEARQARQSLMLATNKAVRRHRKLERDAAIAAIAAELEAGGHKEGKVMATALGKAGLLLEGFASYQLSNNRAEIKRLEGRVAELERRATAAHQAAELEPIEADEEADSYQVRIVEDPVDQRVRILFPGKPDVAMRDRLKGRGFRWSPRNGAWQRQLTANAVAAAREIVAVA